MNDIKRKVYNQIPDPIDIKKVWRQILQQVDSLIRVEILHNIKEPIYNQTTNQIKPQIYNQIHEILYHE